MRFACAFARSALIQCETTADSAAGNASIRRRASGFRTIPETLSLTEVLVISG